MNDSEHNEYTCMTVCCFILSNDAVGIYLTHNTDTLMRIFTMGHVTVICPLFKSVCVLAKAML